jgi:hypothetical protein
MRAFTLSKNQTRIDPVGNQRVLPLEGSDVVINNLVFRPGRRSMALPVKIAGCFGVLEPDDFRFKNADFRFKGSMPPDKECIHHNLQSTI